MSIHHILGTHSTTSGPQHPRCHLRLAGVWSQGPRLAESNTHARKVPFRSAYTVTQRSPAPGACHQLGAAQAIRSWGGCRSQMPAWTLGMLLRAVNLRLSALFLWVSATTAELSSPKNQLLRFLGFHSRPRYPGPLLVRSPGLQKADGAR